MQITGTKFWKESGMHEFQIKSFRSPIRKRSSLKKLQEFVVVQEHVWSRPGRSRHIS